jgi:hypothetical protein
MKILNNFLTFNSVPTCLQKICVYLINYY